MNYYQFHIGDYASATRHLSWDEDAAYRRLLDVYYKTEKPIPCEIRAACRLVLAQTDQQREAVQTVLHEFFVCTADGWINTRADAEIQTMLSKQQSQRDKANKRWHKPGQEHGNATAYENHAMASNSDAAAMPPIPVPAPIPAPSSKDEKEPRKRVTPPCPSDVDPQVWVDWIALRKSKKAPVTETVVSTAARDAKTAGMTLDAYLREWCVRGSQGLKPEWVTKDQQRGGRGEHKYQAAAMAMFDGVPDGANPFGGDVFDV